MIIFIQTREFGMSDNRTIGITRIFRSFHTSRAYGKSTGFKTQENCMMLRESLFNVPTCYNRNAMGRIK